MEPSIGLKEPMDVLFGGIDGGASNTTMVLLDKRGNQLALVTGPATNHWVIGLHEAVKRLLQLIESALQNAGFSSDTKVDHLCLSLSGVDTEANQSTLLSALYAARPWLAGTLRLCNDSVGTSMAATNGDALVLISGTGSIFNYVRGDLTETRLGGYGYLLGDNGSEIQDGLLTWQHSLEEVRDVIYSHFDIKEPLGLLPHFYQNFDKTKIAKLCERLAIGFREALQVGTFSWEGVVKLVRLQLSAAYGSARIAARLGAGVELPIPENAVQLVESIQVKWGH